MHTHTVLSGHGEGTVAELADAAQAAGISALAVTEHYPLSAAYDPDNGCSMPQSAVSGYLSDIEAARDAHPSMDIVAGCELDFLGSCEDRSLVKDDFAPFAIVLGSVHYLDRFAFDDPAEREKWEEPGAADRFWQRYFELWCELAASPGPATVLSHPDLAKKFGYYPSFPLEPVYERAAEAAASAGRMIEVNTSGLFYDCKEMFPAPGFLKAFCRAGVECTVGTDAHTPANVARGIKDAYRMMYNAGYREVTVVTSDGDRRRISLD